MSQMVASLAFRLRERKKLFELNPTILAVVDDEVIS